MNWFSDRLREPSTYAGLAAVVSGLGVLGKVNEAPAIVDAIGIASAPLSQGQWIVGLGTLFAGLMAAFRKG